MADLSSGERSRAESSEKRGGKGPFHGICRLQILSDPKIFWSRPRAQSKTGSWSDVWLGVGWWLQVPVGVGDRVQDGTAEPEAVTETEAVDDTLGVSVGNEERVWVWDGEAEEVGGWEVGLRALRPRTYSGQMQFFGMELMGGLMSQVICLW